MIKIRVTHGCVVRGEIVFGVPIIELGWKFDPKKEAKKIYELPWKANTKGSLWTTSLYSTTCGDLTDFNIISVTPVANYSNYINSFSNYQTVFKINGTNLEIQTNGNLKLGGEYIIELNVTLKDYPALKSQVLIPTAKFTVKVEIYDACIYTQMSSKWHLSTSHTISQQIYQEP